MGNERLGGLRKKEDRLAQLGFKDFPGFELYSMNPHMEALPQVICYLMFFIFLISTKHSLLS